jgi:saccharopine dehydrogenase (NAD+, L-glutamate forming)
MIVMWHKVKYRESSSIQREKHVSLVCIGEDDYLTAMAKTVGLPLAMGCELSLDGEISDHGAILPIKKSIYRPILARLKTHGIEFIEKEIR